VRHRKRCARGPAPWPCAAGKESRPVWHGSKEAFAGLFRLERHFEDYLRAQGRNVGAIRTPSVFRRLTREALDRLIDKQLLRDEVRRRGVTVDAAAGRDARAAVAKGFHSPEAFTRRIREAGSTTPATTRAGAASSWRRAMMRARSGSARRGAGLRSACRSGKGCAAHRKSIFCRGLQWTPIPQLWGNFVANHRRASPGMGRVIVRVKKRLIDQ